MRRFLLLFPGCCSVRAAAPMVIDPVVDLPGVIVSATRTAAPVFDVPWAAVVLDRAELEEKGVRSLPDALRDIPGVLVQKTAAGQGSPYIRGFTGFRNLALVDGIRVNNSTWRDGPNQYWNTIDPWSLAAIELVPGQGSVLYGSDAIGGTLNARTKGPVYGPAGETGGLRAGGQLYTRYASGENAWQTRAEASVSEGEAWGLFLGATLKDYGDLEAAGAGRLPKTGYEETAFDARAGIRLDDGLQFTFARQQVAQDGVWRTHRTIYGVPWEGTTTGSDLRHVFDQARDLTYARLEGQPEAAVDTWQFTLSRQRAEETRDRIRSNRLRDLEGTSVTTWGAALQMTGTAGAHRLTGGADYYRDGVDSYHDDYNAAGLYTGSAVQGPVGDDAGYHLAGVYLLDALTTAPGTELTFGARYTYARAAIGRAADPAVKGRAVSLEDDWHNVSGSVRLVHDLDAGAQHKVYGGIAQGFRAPNLSDLSRFDIARSGEQETGAPGLDPERFVNYEIGWKVLTGAVRGGASLFYTDISGMIVRAPTGRVVNGLPEVTRRNAGDGFVCGMEVNAAYEMTARWTVFGSLAWQRGTVEGFPSSSPVAVEEPVSRLLPVTGQAGLRYTGSGRKWWGELALTAAGRADRLSSGDLADTQRIPPGGTPGYAVASVRAGWRVNGALTVTAAVENFTDEAWRIHGSGQNEPGWNAVLTAALPF